MLEAIREFVSHRIHRPAERAAERPAPHASDVHLAACALLLELAHADDEFSAAERVHVGAVLRRHFGLDDATARELIELAETERRHSSDYYQFTRLIVSQYDLGQRMVLAETMWGVILADGKITAHEAYLVRKLGNLLELSPGYLAQARESAAARHA